MGATDTRRHRESLAGRAHLLVLGLRIYQRFPAFIQTYIRLSSFSTRLQKPAGTFFVVCRTVAHRDAPTAGYDGVRFGQQHAGMFRRLRACTLEKIEGRHYPHPNPSRVGVGVQGFLLADLISWIISSVSSLLPSIRAPVTHQPRVDFHLVSRVSSFDDRAPCAH